MVCLLYSVLIPGHSMIGGSGGSMGYVGGSTSSPSVYTVATLGGMGPCVTVSCPAVTRVSCGSGSYLCNVYCWDSRILF